MRGKVVLLTGASFGIGAALAVRLGAAGATVLLAARSATELETLRARITDAGGSACDYPLDLTNPEQIEAVAGRILDEHGHVDVVVHNAGKSIRRSLFHSLDRAHDFQRCMAVNYLGPVRLQLALLPTMMGRRSGHIVNVSSLGVRLPPAPLWAAYLASKSAFDVWIASAAPELLRSGIACTSVYLGLVHTRMSAPTTAYAAMPGQTADEAACVVCRALVHRPRSIAPWWLEPLRLLALPLEKPVERVQTWLLRSMSSAGMAPTPDPSPRGGASGLVFRIARALWRSGLVRASPWVFVRVFLAWWRCGNTFAFLAEMAAIRAPSRIALHDDDGVLTFAELVGRVESLAASLRLTLAPGSRVAILCRNHRGFVIALLACTRLGLDVLPLGTGSPAPALQKILENQDVSLLIHDDEFTPLVEQCAPSLPARRVEDFGSASRRVPLPRVRRAGHLIVLTSGSTGISKGIRRRPTLAHVLPPLAGLLDALPVQMHRPAVLAIPLHHGYGITTLAMSLTFAAPLHMARQFEIAPLLARMSPLDTPLLVTVPTLLMRWLRQLNSEATPRLAGIICGSAPLDGALSTQAIERLGPILFNLYGSSEAGLIALATPGALRDAPGTVGRPLPGTRVRLVAPEGALGRILVSGPMVLRADRHGWYDTGDLGRLDEAGRLFVCGRADSMFVSGGENVYPHEIEEILASHPAVSEVAIVVVPDAEFGQRMLAAVVKRADVLVDEGDLRDWLRARVERFKLPRSIRLVSAIPRNALGKVDRVALAGLFEG